MGRPYVYQGEPRDYEFGHVESGSVAFFELRPPEGEWSAWTPPVDAGSPEPAPEGDQDELKQPNKAASADDWRLYADQHGGFEAATGKSPLDPATTRKEIVDHYTAEGDGS